MAEKKMAEAVAPAATEVGATPQPKVADIGTTAFVEKSFTAVGSLALGATDKIALVKGGVYIMKINAYAASDQASTTVTCSVDVAAMT